jgi:hypothetical protein
MILKFILLFKHIKRNNLLTAAFAATTNNGCDENLI